ncbi:hypothetical protein [Bradyrhizobium algeriense]|uniref:hypothetical protein n=1 Tax=Bradyrhizobium algeriense TaxID=634784 RepID=UPI000D358010
MHRRFPHSASPSRPPFSRCWCGWSTRTRTDYEGANASCNARAIARGKRQVEDYRKELESMTGETWNSVVDVYRAGK